MIKIKNKLLTLMTVVLIMSLLTTINISSQDTDLSNEEIFELLVRKSLYIDEDEMLTEDHYEAVTYLSTTFHEDRYNWGHGVRRESQQLTDLSLLTKLPNLNYIIFNPLKENPILPSNVNVLDTLGIEYLELGDQEGYGSQVDVTDEQRSALTKIYREFLDSLNGERLDSVLIKDDLISDYQWLVGLNMTEKVSFIYNAHTELNSYPKIKMNYEFSHLDDNGNKVYKMNFVSPLPIVLGLSNEGIIEEDKTYKNVIIEPRSYLSTIANADSPIFYDIDGNAVEQQVPGHYSVDLFFPETLFDEIQEEVNTEVEYIKQDIEYYREGIKELEKLILGESNPEIIEQIESEIRNYHQYINKYEEMLERYETEGISNVVLYHLSLNQEIVDPDSNSSIYLHNEYEIVLGREVPEFYTVSFESNGGTPVDSINNVEENTKIMEPTAPTKAGYTFVAWYKESTLENKWDFNIDVVLEDTTLYAKWDEKLEIVPQPEKEPQNPEESSPEESVDAPNIETGITNNLSTYLLLLAISSSLIIILLKCKRKINI